jgi:hypothetical protein
LFSGSNRNVGCFFSGICYVICGSSISGGTGGRFFQRISRIICRIGGGVCDIGSLKSCAGISKNLFSGINSNVGCFFSSIGNVIRGGGIRSSLRSSVGGSNSILSGSFGLGSGIRSGLSLGNLNRSSSNSSLGSDFGTLFNSLGSS